MNHNDIERLKLIDKRVREIIKENNLLTTETDFEIVEPERMIEAMAYRFPSNFSHWSHGRDYDRLKTIYDNTGSGIPYEVVWNFERPRAYLVNTNPFPLNVIILPHVYAHVDFFLANSFLRRGRAVADIANDARRARVRFHQYEQEHGVKVIENIIEAARTISRHQDLDPFAERIDEDLIREQLIKVEQAKVEYLQNLNGAAAGGFKDRQELEIEIARIVYGIRLLEKKTPPLPDYDLLGYIIDHAPIAKKAYVEDILKTIRDQDRHLFFNGRTKLLNEGWATYWHVRIGRQLFAEGLLTPEEHGEFITFHAQVINADRKGLNWYRIGVVLFEYIKEKYDKGRFGDEYENCKDPVKKMNWDTKAMKGTEKIFQVHDMYSDAMAVREFLTDEFVHQEQLYMWQEATNPITGETENVIAEDDPAVIRATLCKRMAAGGLPVIYVDDGNYDGRGELYLRHDSDGELNPEYEGAALENLFYLWEKPVHLETNEVLTDIDYSPTSFSKRIVHTFDGKKHKIVDA
ncbi:MAG: SpoVR family protein [Candidatus Vogelbacteria bacterium]|nr:SpoVR family protein [Candidatus Vogelbacteria bacterium]